MVNGPRPATNRRAAAAAAIFIATGWLGIAFAPLSGAAGPSRITVALLLGTAFGQSTVAAVWMALGRAGPWHRLAVALGGMGGLLIAVAIFDYRSSAMNGAMLLWAAAGGQWMLTQLPLWALRWRSGLHIEHHSLILDTSGRRTQFGIRQLMVFTAAIAVLLGVGRAIVLLVDWQKLLFSGHPDPPVLAFILLVNTLFMLPFAVGVLLRRWSLLAWFLGALMIAGATLIEIPVVQLLIRIPAPPELPAMFWALNICQAGWVAALLMIWRLAGYRLATREGASESPVASTG